MEKQQLETIDKTLNTQRNLIPASITDEDLLPEYISSYQRKEINHNAGRCYTWHFTDIGSCISTIYESPMIGNGNNGKLIVWVDIWKRINQSTQDISTMVGENPCGAELGGTIHLRLESHIPYDYHECSAFGGTPFLNGILWQNNDWVIGVESQYDSFIPFIAAYPY